MRFLLAVAVCFVAAGSASAKLTAFFPLNGPPVEKLTGAKGEFVGDAALGEFGAFFSGQNGAVEFADSPNFAFAGSFSVYAEVYITDLPERGTSPAGQIVFRGDDRCGLDNYSLNLGNDGFYSFYFNSGDNQGHGVRTLCKKRQWERLLAVFDSNAHETRLYINGFLLGENGTPLFPVTEMDAGWTPRFSIGNVQNPQGGMHNQPFHGTIRNVALYDSVVYPDQVVLPSVKPK